MKSQRTSWSAAAPPRRSPPHRESRSSACAVPQRSPPRLGRAVRQPQPIPSPCALPMEKRCLRAASRSASALAPALQPLHRRPRTHLEAFGRLAPPRPQFVGTRFFSAREQTDRCSKTEAAAFVRSDQIALGERRKRCVPFLVAPLSALRRKAVSQPSSLMLAVHAFSTADTTWSGIGNEIKFFCHLVLRPVGPREELQRLRRDRRGLVAVCASG